MALSKRDKAFQNYALTHWVERRRGALVLLGPGNEELGTADYDAGNEMQQHGVLLHWGFTYANEEGA